MAHFTVVYEGRVREVYSVEAGSVEEAYEKWSDTEPEISEAIDGAVTEVTEDTDED